MTKERNWVSGSSEGGERVQKEAGEFHWQRQGSVRRGGREQRCLQSSVRTSEQAGLGQGQLLRQEQDGRLGGVEERRMPGKQQVAPARAWNTRRRDRKGDEGEETQTLMSHS